MTKKHDAIVKIFIINHRIDNFPGLNKRAICREINQENNLQSLSIKTKMLKGSQCE